MNPRIHEPDPRTLYTLREVVGITSSSERKIIFYCRKGVVAPASRSDDEWRFDEDALARLRWIEALRQRHRMNWAAIEMILRLQHEIEALRGELRFRR